MSSSVTDTIAFILPSVKILRTLTSVTTNPAHHLPKKSMPILIEFSIEKKIPSFFQFNMKNIPGTKI
jgi:hypothetical protein